MLKVVRSGEVQLKLKDPDSIDKLFDKLGISQLCEETPSLSQFMSETSKEYFAENSLPGIGNIVRMACRFLTSVPN